MTHEVVLSFRELTCDVCGQTWFAAEPVCNCEDRSSETDPYVERRRRIVWHAAPPPSTSSPPELLGEPLTPGWDDLSALLNDLLIAIQRVAGGRPDGARALRRALSRLHDRTVAVTFGSRMRPWHAYWTAQEAVLKQIEGVASAYVEALVSGTGPEAEQHAAIAQRRLDEAANAAVSYADRLARWNEIDHRVVNPVDALPEIAAAAFRVASTASIIDLDLVGASIYQRITDSNEHEPGVGLGLSITDFVASILFDRERLWSKTRTAYQLLTGDPARLATLLEDARWMSEYRSAATELRDAVSEAVALSAAATHDHLEIRAILRLAARLVEPIARPLLAPILVVAKSRDLGRLLTKDPNITITQARQAGYDVLTEGLLVALRDADAHLAYRIEGDAIHLTSTRREVSELRGPELLDRVLAGLETVHALHAGLTCALLKIGVSPERLPGVEAYDFSPEQKLRLTLGASGWTQVEIRDDDGVVEASGHGEFPKNPTILGGACLPALRPSTEMLVLVGRHAKTSHTLEMPVEPFRERAAVKDALEAEALFLVGCRLTRFDSEPVYSSDHVHKWIAVMAGKVLNGPQAAKSLRVLRNTAARLGEADLLAAVEAAARLQRAKLLGLPADQADLGKLDLLIQWEKTVL